MLALVSVGATNPQIAGQRRVAESTVKTQVKHILQKLGVVNRAQAISQYLAIQDSGGGLLEQEAAGLPLPQVAVDAATVEQLQVRPGLQDAAAVDDHEPVHLGDGA